MLHGLKHVTATRCVGALLFLCFSSAVAQTTPFMSGDGIRPLFVPETRTPLPESAQQALARENARGPHHSPAESTWRYIRSSRMEIDRYGRLTHYTFELEQAESELLAGIIQEFAEAYRSDGRREVELMCAEYRDPDNPLEGNARALGALQHLSNRQMRIQRWEDVESRFHQRVQEQLGSRVLALLLAERDYYERTQGAGNISTTRDMVESRGGDVTGFVALNC